MSEDNTYVINVTDQLDVKFKEKLAEVGKDLSAIKDQSKNIRSIVLRGGAVVDILLGLKPNDFDLFYSYEEDDKVTSECKCDEVREAVTEAELIYLDKDNIDLENSYEKEPKAEPLQRTCDLISFHKDYISMFVIDEDGQVWTNTQAWQYFQDKVYEVRYEGFLPWAYFPNENDVHNYYSDLARSIVRGIGYIAKRDLEAGERFKILLQHLPYYFEKTFDQTDPARLKIFAKNKIGTYKLAEEVINKIDLDNTEEIRSCLSYLF